jgi:enhancer of mRNA-decapping protein 4
MVEEEPFGTSPIPTALPDGSPVEVSFDTSGVDSVAQQPQSQQIAVYEAKPNEDCINGSMLDVNQHFVVYAVKNGLIRVLHRHSAMKALLRGHQNQIVTDIRFFLDGDVLGTVGNDGTTSTLIVWRVFEQSPEIRSEKLLEIPATSFTMSRLLWHPFNPNQFWMFHTTESGPAAATLVETTRIQTAVHPPDSHAVCQLRSPYCVMDGAVQLSHKSAVTDLAWSGRDTRHVLTVHQGGPIILWDLKQPNQDNDGEFTTPKQVAILEQDSGIAQSRCCFLPHENSITKQDQTDAITTCFVTASGNNSVVTLWSSFTSSALPTKLQVIRLQNPSPSYVIDLCFGPAPQDASPPSCFLLLADRHKGKLLAFHVQAQWNANQKALCVGADYVVPFQLKHPIYSWSVVCSPSQDISEEEIQEQAGLIFDMKLFSYQAKVIQCLTLTSYMCLPPEHGYRDATPGVTVQALDGTKSSSETGSIEPEYDEDYDLEDDMEDEPEAPEPSSLLPPDNAGVGAQNPFANWLGAIASKTGLTAPAPTSPMPPPPPPSTPAAGLGQPPSILPPGLAPTSAVSSGTASTASSQLLNPLELLNRESLTPLKQQEKSKSKKTRSKSPKGKKNNKQKDATPPQFSILKRDKSPPPPTALPSDPAIIGSGMVIPISAELDASLGVSRAPAAAQPMDSTEITKAVEQALQAQLEPAIQKVVQDAMASFGRPLQASMDNLGKKGVSVNKKDLEAALDVEKPLKAAMAETIRNVFIPAVESITAQVLEQVIKNATPPTLPPPPPDNSQALEMLAKQLVAMNAKMDDMVKEMQQLKAGAGAPAMPSPPMPPPPQPDKAEVIRFEIQGLLRQQEYEAAFTKALSATTAEMAVFCCSRADMGIVMGGTPPALSQPILLCLMQQLGSALVSPKHSEMDLQTELTWLQEIALTLNPADPSIQRHTPAVLQQLVANISQKTAQGEPHLRRPLQMLLQVIRGMQMG